jgi:adenine specific DNA methylase Mod
MDYKHSSWLAMMNDRVRESYRYLQANGNICATIDDEEFNELLLLFRNGIWSRKPRRGLCL